MTIDGKKWGVPYTYYQWGIYYNRDAYKAAGVEEPKTWDEVRVQLRKVQAAGIDCVTTGSKALWPVAGIFDYLNLRTNGYEFHMDLTAGKVAWTDPKVKDVFAEVGEDPALHHRQPCRDRLAGCGGAVGAGQGRQLCHGQLCRRRLQGRRHDQRHLGFMVFPEITPGLPRAEEAPTDTIHIPAGAKNVGRCQEVPGLRRLGRCADQVNAASASCRPTRIRPCRRRPVHQGGLRIAVGRLCAGPVL
jgi:multiple sugar transport system substrate-binding protein